MSLNKKYYWLKLKSDFFTDIKIKKLRKIAGGDTYTIILMKIMLLSIKSGGEIEFEGVENTLEEELALILDEEVENVKIALTFMSASGLIEKIDERLYFLPSVVSLIGSESDSAERVRRFRNKNKNIKALQCNGVVTDCNKNVTTEKEKEKEKEIEIEIDKNTIFDKIVQKPEKQNESALRVANHLLSQIIQAKPNFKKPNLNTWAKDIDLAMRIDKRTEQDLLNAIDWIYGSKKGAFWIPNILSAKKLREKYDTIEAQAMSDPQTKNDEMIRNALRSVR